MDVLEQFMWQRDQTERLAKKYGYISLYDTKEMTKEIDKIIGDFLK